MVTMRVRPRHSLRRRAESRERSASNQRSVFVRKSSRTHARTRQQWTVIMDRKGIDPHADCHWSILRPGPVIELTAH
jgi:hypothetical protein